MCRRDETQEQEEDYDLPAWAVFEEVRGPDEVPLPNSRADGDAPAAGEMVVGHSENLDPDA
jgi:hypothetical protein